MKPPITGPVTGPLRGPRDQIEKARARWESLLMSLRVPGELVSMAAPARALFSSQYS